MLRELTGTLLAYADDNIILGDSCNEIKESTKELLSLEKGWDSK